MSDKRIDYYVTARNPEYPNQQYENHAGLRPDEANLLFDRLKSLHLEDIVVEPVDPEWYTLGFDSTLNAVLYEMGIEAD